MVHRKTLKRKLCNMSVKKATDIYKSMTVLHAKRKFHYYKDAFKYLLALTYENASLIGSLQLNNRALAKAVQKEKENTAVQLKERLSTESLYLDLLREYGILKTKLSSFENNLIQIDESVKTSMIPNLVRLSDDITTLKINCDVLRSAVGTTYEPDTTTRIYPKNIPMERNPRIISDAGIPSPVLEEVEDETIQLTARKCKGGLRNAFNISTIRDRRMNRSLMMGTNLESSFNELNSVEGRLSSVPSEVDRQSRVPSEVESKSDVSSNVESSHIIPDSPAIIILSPRPPTYSPAVVLRRVLTPINSFDLNDSVHSTTVISFKDKSPSINTDDDISRVLPKSERKRSTHSSYFGQYEESGGNRSILTERKKSKQSYFFKKNDENKQNIKSESFKTSSHILNASSMNETNDHLNENTLSNRSRSRRRSSFRENEVPLDNFSLIGERKRYRTRSSTRISIIQCDEENSNQSTLKAENRESMPMSTTFGNETSSENSLNDSRRLRTRSRNVCYKERPLNVKLRN